MQYKLKLSVNNPSVYVCLCVCVLYVNSSCGNEKQKERSNHQDKKKKKTSDSHHHHNNQTTTRQTNMHPQLDKTRFDTCDKLMDALEECHRQEFLKQCLGLCNFEKEQLSQCLHYTRVNDAKERIRQSQEKQAKLKLKQKQREEEEYGKNGYLKKVIELEMQKK